MKRISAIAFSVILICISFFSVSAVDYKCDVETVSKAVYLENLNNKAVVYEKNSDQQMYPASTTKIMTFIITAENVGNIGNTYVTVKEGVISGLDPESTMMGLTTHIGEKVSVKDLLYGLMLPSGNDAALVLADYVGEGIPGFVEKMNAKANELGCKKTHFANPHGLYDSEHYSTAYDMALIAKYAMNLPNFMEICNTVRYTPKGFEELHNTNYMLDPEEEGGKYYYEYTKGIKTGYLDQAGKCLVTSSDKGGDKYLCVCLGADYFYEEDVNYAMLDTSKLYGWSYENLGIQTVYSPADSLDTVDVKYVRDGKTLNAVPEKDISAFLPKNYDKSKLKVETDCPEQVEAPVKKGDVLGTVSVKYEDLDLGTTNLVSPEDVERTISPIEAFVTENPVLVIILAAVLVLIIIIIIILIAARSARKRRRAREAYARSRYGYNAQKNPRQRPRSNKGRRFRD